MCVECIGCDVWEDMMLWGAWTTRREEAKVKRALKRRVNSHKLRREPGTARYPSPPLAQRC